MRQPASEWVGYSSGNVRLYGSVVSGVTTISGIFVDPDTLNTQESPLNNLTLTTAGRRDKARASIVADGDDMVFNVPVGGQLLRSTNGDREPLLSVSAVMRIVTIEAEELVWNIQHDLNTYPLCLTLDVLGNVILGDIRYVDTNNISVSFTAPIAGKAIVSI